ncbi:UDP-N-acetylmuramate dehydrogenase [Saccharicrinis carchari]|uniref:UDP-N-acetylenolpyruvoylglucosamine reductase n=1 Tax=Saccharicrinis carchari TaxID=1168039 RepID=A0A521BD09_SACCC|nr:UDP-N-acetylmuramate dehydrogenase [Saccharicrinis carchari]SMO44978.1 UDP-N-acetylmuramate dehydrogenase [Saccharicrinis carchari]
MVIQHYALKPHNTFHFNVYADYFSAPKNSDEIIQVLTNPLLRKQPLFILGGGSNVLFKSDFKGFILKPDIQSIRIIKQNEQSVWVEAGAGIDWDSFVAWSVDKGYYGIENLSLIPGNVGASPVQNIGAYGTEIMNVITRVNGIFLDTLEPFSFTNSACDFSYRNSIFKNKLKGKTIITSVEFVLGKQGKIKTDYAGVKEEVFRLGKPTLKNARQAIINIRESKLPDPELVGNAGSFFKNPVVKSAVANAIALDYPDAPIYKVDDQFAKIPAGWMIEQCGWKGKSMGNAAVHKNQALVLINKTGKATGEEMLALALEIERSVKLKFGIEINKEVNVV